MKLYLIYTTKFDAKIVIALPMPLSHQRFGNLQPIDI